MDANKHKILLLLGFVLLFYSLKGQDSISGQSLFKIEGFTFAGKSLAHHTEMKELCQNPFFGTELRFGWQTTGNDYWHQAFNYPYYGFGYYVADFNHKAIGYPMALFSFLELPFYRSKNASISTGWSAGITFNINEFDSVQNPQNVAIGTDVNAYIDFTLSYKYKLNNRFNIGTGLKLQHFSNGALRLPNYGLNMLGTHVSLAYIPKGFSGKFRTVNKPHIDKKYEFYLMYAGGYRYKNNDKIVRQYFNSTLSMAASRRVSFKRTVGIGLDVFYNECYKEELISNDIAVTNNKLISQSVFVTSDLIANKFRMALCLGFYTWRYNNYTLPFYERVALRYYFLPQMFGNVSIKAHAARAEYIEWGIGFSF